MAVKIGPFGLAAIVYISFTLGKKYGEYKCDKKFIEMFYNSINKEGKTDGC